MEFQSSTPIYLQLIDMLKLQIVSGKLKSGDKLPSVRDLALEYGVNPNTMQKALSQLEGEKLVNTVRTPGRYVPEERERLRYSSPTLLRKVSLALISFKIGLEIIVSRSPNSREFINSSSSVTDISQNSIMFLPPTVTAKYSGFSLLP